MKIMASGPITSQQIQGWKVEIMTDFLFLGSKIIGWWLQPWSQKMFASWQESYNKPRQCAEKQRHYSANKGLHSQGYGHASAHVQFWELSCKEDRVPESWCLQTAVLEKSPESPLGSKEIKPVNLKGDQPWILSGRIDAEAETDDFGHLLRTADSLEKTLMLGKIEGRRREHQRLRWLDGITDAMDMNLGKLQEMLRDREAFHAAVHGSAKSWTGLGNWTTTISAFPGCEAVFLFFL